MFLPFAFLFGVVFVVIFVAVVLGFYKSWYITRPMGTMFHPNMVYGMFTLGLSFVYGSIMTTFPNYSPESWHFSVITVLIIITLIFSVWVPPFLKPWWIKLLERDYGYCLPILIEEARKLGRWQWESRVRTPAQMQS